VNDRPELDSRPPAESPPLALPGDWQVVSGLIRREQLLMPSADLRTRLAESLEALPQQMRREFPNTPGHWGLLSVLLLPTVLLYALLYGLWTGMGRHLQALVYQYGGWMPRLGTNVVRLLASIQSGRRPGLLEGLPDPVPSFALQAEWQWMLLGCGVSLLVAELLAILLLHRLKACNP